MTPLAKQLLELGVGPGAVLLVHAAFSKVGPLEGGPRGLIAALQEAVGTAGTLVMPSKSDNDAIPFDVKSADCKALGVVADTFWRLPGVLRSDNPHGFSARGPRAAEITAAHSLDVPAGVGSPVWRIREMDGQVLLLGVGHDANTTIHLAEALAGVRYRRQKYLTVLEEGRPKRYEYRETDHCCELFAQMDAWLDAAGLQRRGRIAHGEARLARSRDVVKVALERLLANEAVFLHPKGVDIECDEARASLDS